MATPQLESLTTFIRPLTETEIQELVHRRDAIDGRSRRSTRDVVVVAIGIWVAMSGITLASSSAPRGVVVVVWAAIASVIAIWGARRARREFAAIARSLTETLTLNTARVTRVRAESVAAFESATEDVRGFLFQVDGTRVLFVDGSGLCGDAPFPSTEFSISEIRSPAGKVVHRSVESTGTPLEPVTIVPQRVVRKLHLPEDLTAIDGRLEDLEQLLAVARPR